MSAFLCSSSGQEPAQFGEHYQQLSGSYCCCFFPHISLWATCRHQPPEKGKRSAFSTRQCSPFSSTESLERERRSQRVRGTTRVFSRVIECTVLSECTVKIKFAHALHWHTTLPGRADHLFRHRSGRVNSILITRNVLIQTAVGQPQRHR